MRLDRPFRLRDAVEEGWRPRDVDARHFDMPFQGLRTPLGTGADFETRCHAYMLRMRPDGAFTSLTAAAIWGIPLPADADLARLHVSVPHGAPRPRSRGVNGSERSPADAVVSRRGLRVLDAAETWMSLARVLSWPDLVAAGDFLVESVRGSAITSPAALARVAERRIPGAVTARRALAAISERSLSRPESLLRVLLRSAGLPPAAPNFVLDRPRAMIDLAWPAARFGIEYLGDHHRDVRQFRRDVRRQEEIHDEGWLLMMVSASELFDHPGELVARVARRLEARGQTVRGVHPSKWCLPRR